MVKMQSHDTYNRMMSQLQQLEVTVRSMKWCKVYHASFHSRCMVNRSLFLVSCRIM